jgi:tetratricopeptide (TPR) repeat protein
MLRAPPIVALLLCALVGTAGATGTPKAPAMPAWLDSVLSSGTFQAHHPDIRNQQRGLAYYRQRRHDEALAAFRRAAHYADKASQALLAQMHWRGEGVPADRALAYAWMDLAAERGYPIFLVEREKYWAALTEAEQARAVEVGRGLYERYGDDVAKPRLARVMRLGQWRSMTGSRTGYDAGIRVAQPGADGSLDPSSTARADVYDARYWHPESYWALQDRIWIGLPRGEVIVQPLRPDDQGDAVAPSDVPDPSDGRGED